MLRRACVAVLCLPACAAAQEGGSATSPPDGVKFDLKLRERVELLDDDGRFLDRREPVAAYHRAIAGVAARRGPLAIRVEAGAHLRSASGPSVPIERDVLDLQQSYADALVGDQRTGARLRVGRAEMAFELIASRDAPNVRRTWDGARATGWWRNWTLDAFAARVVQPRRGAFDDGSGDGDRLAGVHLQSPGRASRPVALSAFLYDVRQERFALLPGVARASTRTLGGVLSGEVGGLELSGGGARQWGRFGARQVDAFYLEGEVGRTGRSAWRPRLAVRSSLFSGGRPEPGRITTFNPLFPNFAYSTEAALQSPSNLVKAALLGMVAPTNRLSIEYRGEGLWRYSSADAFYTPAGTPFIRPDAGENRWAGLQQQLKAVWRANPRLTYTAAVVRFDAGRFLKAGGLGNQTFGLLQAEFTLD